MLYICIKQRGNSPLIKNLTTMKTLFTVNEAGYTDSVSVFSSENEAKARDFFNKKRNICQRLSPPIFRNGGIAMKLGGMYIAWNW